MSLHKIFISIVASLAALGAGASIGACANSETAVRYSRKGEACQFSNDCSSGLACVPRPGGEGGICVTGEFRVAKVAKECARIECQEPKDCCPDLTTAQKQSCQQYEIDCDNGMGSMFACTQFDAQCKCDGTKYECRANACRSVGVKCTSDAQCPGSSKCDTTTGECISGCKLDSDCPSFNRCNAGVCAEDTCKSDRECVAATGNVEAKCDTTEKECFVPCQSDLECGSSVNYRFYSCITNRCVYTGCENDKECQLYYQAGATIVNPTPQKLGSIVCRDKVRSP